MTTRQLGIAVVIIMACILAAIVAIAVGIWVIYPQVIENSSRIERLERLQRRR